MTEPDLRFTERDITVQAVAINGEEHRVSRVLEFLDAVEGTDGAASTVRWCHEFDAVAETLIGCGMVETTVRGSWYATDDDAVAALRERIQTYHMED